MLFHYKEDNIEIYKTLFEGEEINTVEDVIHKMIDIYEREGKPEYLKSGNCNLAIVMFSLLFFLTDHKKNQIHLIFFRSVLRLI